MKQFICLTCVRLEGNRHKLDDIIELDNQEIIDDLLEAKAIKEIPDGKKAAPKKKTPAKDAAAKDAPNTQSKDAD